MADLEIKYNNSTISTRSASGTTTLETAGKFCTNSFQVNYYGTAWAKINVTYPSNSVCTATNGTITLTAVNNSQSMFNTYSFEIPEPSSTPETWTISCTDGTNIDSKIISITTKWQIETVFLSFISVILNNATWEEISMIAQAGIGDSWWDIGDAKQITFKSGAIIGSLSVSNLTLCVFILDFNHPENGVADNNILFSGFKSAVTNGVDIALIDSYYGGGETYITNHFNLNHWVKANGTASARYNYGGWKGCDLRYDILGGTSTPPSGYGSVNTSSRVDSVAS